VDSAGDTQFPIGTSQVVSTQAQLDAAIGLLRNFTLDHVVIDGTALTIPRGGLDGLGRPANNPARISTANGGKLQLGIHDDSHAWAGVAFVDCDLVGDVQLRGDRWRDVLFEGCTLWLDAQGERLSGGAPGAPAHNLQIRRCTIRDHWGAGARVQGAYIWNINGVLIQDTWMHHNGWKPGASRSLPRDQGGGSVYNHNLYASRPNSNFVVDHCVTSEASSHGIHLKCGGVLVDTLAIDCPIAFQPAYGGDGLYSNFGLASATMRGCVALGSDDINTSDGNLRGVFCWLTCLNNGLIEDNIAIANTTSRSNDAVFWVDRKTSPTGDFTLRNNRAYGWPGAMFISPGTYPLGNIIEDGNQLDLPLETRHTELLSRVRAITAAGGWNNGKPGVSRSLLDGILAEARGTSSPPPPPPPSLEVFREKVHFEPNDGETIDLSNKLFLGLWSTAWPEDQPPPSTWPTHQELEDQGKPDSDERFPLTIGGTASGARVLGGRAHHLVHPAAPWHVWKLGGDSDGIRFEAGGQITVERTWCDNVTDGFNPRGDAQFLIQGCCTTRVHDDALENDDVCSGIVRDSYFAGHTFYSARGESNPSAVVVIEDCVIELILQPYQGGSDADDYNEDGGYYYPDGLGCGTMFKMEWDGSDQTDSHTDSGTVELRNCVFYVPRHSSSSMKAMRWPHGTYSNVTVVWQGDGDYPWPAPAGVTVTRDRSVFDQAKAAFFARHPEFQEASSL
jgi:hypothetical protein